MLEKRDVAFCNNVESQILRNINQTSTPSDTLRALKQRYRFAKEPMRESEDEEDYSIVEEDLSQKRKKFFNGLYFYLLLEVVLFLNSCGTNEKQHL